MKKRLRKKKFNLNFRQRKFFDAAKVFLLTGDFAARAKAATDKMIITGFQGLKMDLVWSDEKAPTLPKTMRDQYLHGEWITFDEKETLQKEG